MREGGGKVSWPLSFKLRLLASLCCRNIRPSSKGNRPLAPRGQGEEVMLQHIENQAAMNKAVRESEQRCRCFERELLLMQLRAQTELNNIISEQFRIALLPHIEIEL